MRYRLKPWIALSIGGLLCGLWHPAVRAAEFTPAQRAEIVRIVRDALKQDVSLLRDAIAALQADETEQEKAAARAALASVRDQLVLPSDPAAGNPRGDVTIVMFFDVRCTYCRKFEPDLTALLASDPNVRLVYKDLPILGAASVLGSRALLAAHRQNAYQPMHDAVMRMPSDITRAGIEAEAGKLGLDIARLTRDMESGPVKAQIDANLRLAHVLNIQGTPAMVIGDTVTTGAVDAGALKRLVADARGAKK